MRRLATCAGLELTWRYRNSWRQPGHRLVTPDGEETVRAFYRAGWRQSVGTAETVDGTFSFVRTGLLRPSIDVTSEAGGEPLATYTYPRASPTSTIDVVFLPDGSELTIRRRGFLFRSLELVDESGAPLLTLHRRGLLGHKLVLVISPGGAARPELPWLVPLFHFVELSVLRIRRSLAAG